MELIDEAIRPEIISLREDGDRIVLVRPNGIREFAFLVFSERTTGTRTHIEFRFEIDGERYSTQSYSVCCACCGVETYGFDNPEDKEEKEKFENKKKRELLSLVVRICRENGIRFIGMRKASCWNDKLEEIRTFEAHEFEDSMTRLYGTEVIREKMRCMRM